MWKAISLFVDFVVLIFIVILRKTKKQKDMKDLTEEERKAILDNLQPGQGKSYIAFKYPFGTFNEPTLVISDISFINNDVCMCHFLMGYKSECYEIEKEDVIAVGDVEQGDVKFRGWSGKLLVLRPDLIQRISESDEWELIGGD